MAEAAAVPQRCSKSVRRRRDAINELGDAELKKKKKWRLDRNGTVFVTDLLTLND